MPFGDRPSAKFLFTAGLWLALVAFVALFVYTIVKVLLLVFAGILIAIFLHGCGDWVRRHSGLSYRAGVGLTVLSLLVLFGLCGWLIAPNIEEQFTALSGALQKQLEHMQQVSTQSQWYQILQTSMQQVLGVLSPLKKISDLFVDAIVIAFVALYLAFEPDLYRNGILALAPSQHRAAIADTLGELGATLWRWFIGRLIGMAVIGVLVFIGVWAVGIPLAFTLGLIATVLEFVPYVGAIVSAFPALLLASQQGWQAVWIILVVYLVVHGIDGYVVIPLVERKAVRIPPALTIVVQLAMFMTASFLGVLVADPLAACGLVLVKRFYLDRPERAALEQVPQEAHS